MNSANAMDVAEIKVAVRKIKLYDSEDGKEEADDIVGIRYVGFRNFVIYRRPLASNAIAAG